MIGRELDEIVRELYVLPPAEFVTARNELVRQARAAGSRDVAERLRQLRRPTRSAWLVNLLASDSRAMQRLSALGRELRDAQTGLVRTELRNLAEHRRQLIADLLDRTKAHAAEAGVRLTPTVLSEVEATLQAALVDLAGALTIRNGRLVRPLSHSGFGPRPRNALQSRSTVEVLPVGAPAEPAAEIAAPPVEDELELRGSGVRWAAAGPSSLPRRPTRYRWRTRTATSLRRPTVDRKHFVSCDQRRWSLRLSRPRTGSPSSISRMQRRPWRRPTTR